MSVNYVTATSAYVYEDTTLTSARVSQDLSTTDYLHDYHDYEFEYEHYVYPGYTFERIVYSYVWTIFVIVMSLVNIVAIYILLQRKMRNPTNVVLAAIAISDLLTGLTTLPTYIMVYQSTEPSDYVDYPVMSINSSNDMASYVYEGHQAGYHNYSTFAYHYGMYGNGSDDMFEVLEYEGYHLSKDLCRWFMATKFFISKTFHSISIYLTLLLGIHRFISVAALFNTHALTTPRAILVCIIITVLSPALHVYHLIDERANPKHGMCEWALDEKGCGGGCIQLWITFVLRYVIPCGLLLMLTIFLIRALYKKQVGMQQSDRHRWGQNTKIVQGTVGNRRIAVMVTAIVIIFLIPEIPYGFYLLHNAIDKTAYNGEHMDLETNRAVHLAYEVMLVLSFHAKFFTYALLNRKFRSSLITIFVQPIRRVLWDNRRVSNNSTGSQRIGSNALMNTIDVDITRKSNNDQDQFEAVDVSV